MTTSPFELFINLVQFDQAITKLKHDQQNAEKLLEQHKQEKQTLSAEIEQLKATVHDAQKAVHEKELEAKKLDLREADLKKKLDDLGNIKQYAAFKKELDHLKQEQAAHDDAVIAAWNQLETSQRNLQQKKSVIEQKVTETDTAIDLEQHKIKELQHEIDHAISTRPSLAEQVNADWLKKYEMMHGRVENPVVEVMQGGCGGCFYTIPAQDLARLKNKALLQCNSCYRFLYDSSFA